MKKILIVEDDPIILKIYQSKFKLSGFEVISALDGEEGIEKAQKEHPDFIILDLMMPKVSGVDVLKKLSENSDTNNIPVGILTVVPPDSSNIPTHILDKLAFYWLKDEVKPSDVLEDVKGFL